MNISEFHQGTQRQQFQYRSFQPSLINHTWTWEAPEIHALLAEGIVGLEN